MPKISYIKRNSLLLSVFWTILISTLLIFHIREQQGNPVKQAELQAKSVINDAISFRSWAAYYGGVYVAPTEKYPPNPYLKVPNRDVVTTDGKRLTLINPAYMMRQVFQDFTESGAINGHMTSLKLLNPDNKPDTWESGALHAFENGSKHESTIATSTQGNKIFRYMQPLYIEKSCLKCHSEQKYKVGDVRGGISTFVDMSKYEAITASSINYLLWIYGAVWVLGVIGIFTSVRHLSMLDSEREHKINLLAISEHLAQEFINEMSLISNLDETLNAIATMLSKRDAYTAGHQRRVAHLAEKIALEMALPEERVRSIRLAATVHDIGKIQVPAEVLTKSGKLNDVEFDLIKLHPQAGYDILKGVKFPWPIALSVLQHHERLDGSGYPQGLKGDEIILEARVIAVADVVEAMSGHRPYRAAIGLEAALTEISNKRGIWFDPAVVDACIKLFRECGYVFPEELVTS